MSKQPDQQDFAPSGFFALRTPLLPFDDLLAWGAGLGAAAAPEPSRLPAVLDSDRCRLRDRLRTVVARPEVREALFVASTDLEERLEVWTGQPDSEAGRKLERTLVRYFSRMAGRATPFGLFAGCSVGTFGPETRLVLPGRAEYQRHARLDMDYIVNLTHALARDPSMQPWLEFSVNSSLYQGNGRVCLVESRRNGRGWAHHQVALQASDYLTRTLARASSGASAAMLSAALAEDDPEGSLSEAQEYIADLIENQVLISELHPSVTGPEPISVLVARLRNQAGPAGQLLEEVRSMLAALDGGQIGAAPERYRTVAGLLERLPGKIEPGKLFRVDMIKPAVACSLGPEVLAETARGIGILHRLARPPLPGPLLRFREAFQARYEGREVPLVEALGPDTGVGFDRTAGAVTDASSLLEDLTFPEPVEESGPWGKRDIFLLGRLSEALMGGHHEIVLSPRDLEEISSFSALPLPPAFFAMTAVAAQSDAALARGDFRVLLYGAGGPSGARMLGRFCHADPLLGRYVQEHLRAEEALQPDAVFAEVVHLPEGRAGNLLVRPTLRAYEIPYLGRSSVPAERQIPVTDLLVSVADDQIVLRSARLGRRVLPRLTNAHDFRGNQGIYQFLCALQAQGTTGDIGWDWGVLRDAPFLPRVVTGRLVLSRARWQVSRRELRALDLTDASARFQAVQLWRVERRLPRWIALADSDNELPIDLDNVLSIETFVGLVKNRDQATLVELFPGPEELCAHGPEGRFVHELVIPFVRKRDDETREQVTAAGRTHRGGPSGLVRPAQRRFPPGSEWLYAKLYTGSATADQVLLEVVRPVSTTAKRSGATDCWFFIRYGDPDWHVRVRFHGDAERLMREVLPALQLAARPLLEDGRIWRFQLDTYEREIERYGGVEGIVVAEQLFHADSEAALALIEQSAEDARGEARWRLVLQGMDHLLTDLGFDLAGKLRLVRQTRDALTRELHGDSRFQRQLGAKYRKDRHNLEGPLVLAAEREDRQTPERLILGRRSEQGAPWIASLKALETEGRLCPSVVEQAVSYLHMHANRLFRSAARAQELVLYDFLARTYASRAARNREEHASGAIRA